VERSQLPSNRSNRPDKAWFTKRTREVGLSQRKLARAINLDPSSFNRTLQGWRPGEGPDGRPVGRRVQLDEVIKLAELLKTRRDEMIERLGFPDAALRVPIVGKINGDGHVRTSTKEISRVVAPPEVPPEVQALVFDTANTWLAIWDECLLYFGHVEGVLPGDVGRICVVTCKDRTVVGVLSRGSTRGKHKVTVFGTREVFAPDEIVSASPMLWIRSP